MNRDNRAIATLFMATDVSQKLRSALEFSVVLAIIMVATSLAVRSFQTHLIHSQVAEALMLTSTVRGEMVTFRAENGRWPATARELHNPALQQESGVGKYTDRLELQDGGAIFAVFDEESSASVIQGRGLTLRPMQVTSDPGGPISWVCAAHQVPDGLAVGGTDLTDIDPSFLPSVCREY